MSNEANPFASPEHDEMVAAPQHTGEIVLAGRVARLGAAILETIIYMVVCVPGMVAFVTMQLALSSAMAESMNSNETYVAAGLSVLNIVLFTVSGVGLLAVIVYNILLIFSSQQTMGKKILHMRVVRSNGDACSGIRYLFLRGGVMMLLSNIPIIGMIISFADPLFIFRSNKQCLHDLIADTIVVKCE